MSTKIESMSTTTNAPAKNELGEPDAHVISRHLRVTIRGLLIIFVLATLVLFLFYRQAAYLAAIPVPLLAVALILVDTLEHRSRASALRKAKQSAISEEEVELDVQAVGIATALKIFGVLALGTFIIAAAFFDSAGIGIGATATLLLALLIELPFLLVGISEAERDEREKLTGKRE